MLIFKKLFVYIFVVGSTLTFATSCSKDEADPQPQKEFKVYVTTYAEAQNKKATNAPSNRAQVVEDGSYYNVKFADGDVLLVWGTTKGTYFYGSLTLQTASGTTSGTFSGSLTVGSGGSSDPLTDFQSINAILAPTGWSSKGYSFEESSHSYKHSTYVPVSSMTAIGPYLPIVKTAYVSSSKTFTLEAQGCVMHVVWSGMKASQSYTIHTYDKSGDGKVDYCGGSMTSDSDGKLDFYIPSTLSTGYYFVLNGDKEYTYDLTGTATTEQKIYRLKRTFLTNLSGQYTASDGDRFIGSTAYGIKIPAGATITLENATIYQETSTSPQYPAISCEGNATIKLVGTNIARSEKGGNPGVLPGGEGTKLTIEGSGSLSATGTSNAAGIGSGGDVACGNILIQGGTITATGGSLAAGIGSGFKDCGTITITSGATKIVAVIDGSYPGSGNKYIGKGGDEGSCGTVTIDGILDAWTGTPTFPNFYSFCEAAAWKLTHK